MIIKGSSTIFRSVNFGSGRVFQDRIAHRNALKLSKIDLVLLVAHRQPARSLRTDLPQQLFAKSIIPFTSI